MNARLAAWIDKIETLSTRERAMIVIATLGLAATGWNFLLFSPAQTEIQFLTHKNNETQLEIAGLAEQRVQLLEHPPIDPNQALKDALLGTQRDLKSIDEQLHSATTDLISSQRMVEVLRALVSDQGLELLSVKSLPVVPIATQDALTASAPSRTPSSAVEPEQKASGLPIINSKNLVADAVDRALGRQADTSAPHTSATEIKVKPRATLFRHGLEIQMRGGFTRILHYLHATENLPWRLYWDTLEYKVETYPDAKIILRVYTLSVDEGWIGV